MNIAKYNIPAGAATKANVGTTAVEGGGYTVDLTPITDKVAALESKVSYLEMMFARMQAAFAGLDSKYLSKMGDRSDYSYYLGSVYTDFLQSEMYDNGVGYRMSGSPTAATEDKYNLIVKDYGWGEIPFSTVNQDTATYVDSDTDEATSHLVVNNIVIGQTTAPGYLLVDCGATLTSERCFTEISKKVTYTVHMTIGQATYVDTHTDTDTDSNGNFIIHFGKADNVKIDINFIYTYAFRHVGSMTSGTLRLYIRGTDPSNSKTNCFGEAVKVATLNAGAITVMKDEDGMRLTSGAIQETSDGGATWTDVSGGGGSSSGGDIEVIDGTHGTTATAAWTGVTRDAALTDGKVIVFTSHSAGASNVTLNLTLSSGTTTGAKPVFYSGTTRLSTHNAANSPCMFRYYSDDDCWRRMSDYDTNTFYELRNQNTMKSKGAIVANSIIVGDSTGYITLASGVTFDVSYPIMVSTTAYAANKTFTTASYNVRSSFSLRANVSGWTGTAYNMVYIVGTLSGSTFTVDSAVFSCTVPASEDGKCYIPIGLLYSAYQVRFEPFTPHVYKYYNGKFQRIDADLSAATAESATAAEVNNACDNILT